MIDEQAERAYARNYINDFCIVRVPPGSKDLPMRGGGGYYSWQFYLRRAYFNPRIIRFMVRNFFKLYGELLGEVQLAGVESASTPLLTAIALESSRAGCPINIFSIRKERKAYGLRNWIEGAVSDEPVLLLDDLVSSRHYTMRHALNVLDVYGIETCPHIFAGIYKTKTPEKLIHRRDRKYTVGHMFSLNDFDMMLEDYQRAHLSAPNEEMRPCL